MENSRTIELIGLTIQTEWKETASQTVFLNILSEVEEIWEDLEANGVVTSISNGDRRGNGLIA
jgi:hypothetical protein